MWRWASLAFVAAVICVACDEDDDPSDASLDAFGADAGAVDVGHVDPSIDTGPPGAPDTFDPSCHWDCFFGVTCTDGVVWEQIHAPVPCSAWTGMCPRRQLGRCTEGCSDRVPIVTFLREADWTLWCEETEASRPGDPCSTDDDCQPPEGYEPGGRSYLACDAASSTCVSIDPPVEPDGRCAASFDGIDTATYGTLEDSSCSSGWCQFSGHTCHACVLPCTDHWDCPPSQRCEEHADFTDRSAITRRGICRRPELPCD